MSDSPYRSFIFYDATRDKIRLFCVTDLHLITLFRNGQKVNIFSKPNFNLINTSRLCFLQRLKNHLKSLFLC